MISVCFQGKPFNITVIQVYAPTSNAEEKVERFYEDLQDLLERTHKKDVLFIIGDWNAKVGSQETPGVTAKFGLGIRNEAGQRLIEFCQENARHLYNLTYISGDAHSTARSESPTSLAMMSASLMRSSRGVSVWML